eukprot:3746444-Rhodomonas_salina.1
MSASDVCAPPSAGFASAAAGFAPNENPPAPLLPLAAPLAAGAPNVNALPDPPVPKLKAGAPPAAPNAGTAAPPEAPGFFSSHDTHLSVASALLS